MVHAGGHEQFAAKGIFFNELTKSPRTQGDKLTRRAVLSCDKVSQHQGWFSKGTRVFGGGHYGGFAGSMVTEPIGPQ